MTTIIDFINKTARYTLDSKVWVHFFIEPFSEQEATLASNAIRTFSENWQAHGKKLENAIELIHRQILITSVNSHQNQPTGCSIDALNHWVNDFSKLFNKNLAPREYIFYIENNEIFSNHFDSLAQIWDKKDDILVANLFYNQISDVREKFWVRIEDSHFRNLYRKQKL